MSMLFAKWNAPYDMIQLGQSPEGASLKMCFFVITFDSTSVGGVSGTTYDPTNHYTTNIPLARSAGKDVYSLWGINKVHRMVFNNGASDATIKGTTANTGTGEFKAEYVESGNYLRFKVIGTGTDTTNGYTVTEEEVDSSAGNLNASGLRLTGYLIGS
ncbi:MAG: hypothetical protein FJZ00_03110 [Candidatus Sericytochromatia bacterium]|uniref:Uncharacterized protein n=1 Tax=Candidatus Tanganyikabacteria bacterium TaxID=2961651 RepID=A0A938BML4_9BACT|nr:hypothetical protein [Candidatus Tanganyikabacteria bacterium]